MQLAHYIFCITSSVNINDYLEAPKQHTEQTVSFNHQDDSWKLVTKSEPDSTFDYGYVGDADLAGYLGRPTKITEVLWTVAAGSFDTTINPWKLFVEDANVRKRIEGYKMLRGKLHLRITINGNPFLYGRAMASYFPRAGKDEFAQPTDATLVTMQESMRPHIFLDPTSSSGGEMVLPFLCPDNWIELNGQTADLMGTLRLRSFNDLLHANSATGTAQITVFAWMDEVKLAGPTQWTFASYNAQSGFEPGPLLTGIGGLLTAIFHVLYYIAHWKRPPDPVLETQAGDEYGQGIISKPASTVAKVAGYLERVPVIGNYARATEMVASGVAKVASIFGFSRPAILSDIVRVKPTGLGAMAVTDAPDAVQKLTLDSKQELCVDPRTVGLSDLDEMTMKFIAQKECFLGTCTWAESQVDGTTLRVINVTPLQHNHTTTGVTQTLLAPMATVALPFRYWRGSIKFRFQIVASQMHRGRLKINYDPHICSSTSGYNENYSRAVDLAGNRDIEFVVGWNSHRSWLQVDDQDSLDPATGQPNHSNSVFHEEDYNGQLRLSVLNQLTSPDPSLGQNIYINIYACAGEDFELACPTEENIQRFEYIAQSGFESQAGEENEEAVDGADNEPESASTSIVPAGDTVPMDATNHVYMGEDFQSIRALLKRYCYHSSAGAVTNNFGFWWREYNFPYYRGQYVKFFRHQDNNATPVPTNFASMTLLNWFVPCYVGWRGGIRWKFNSSHAGAAIYVRRDRPQVNTAQVTAQEVGWSNTSESELADERQRVHGSGKGGIGIAKAGVDAALEAEFPFQSYKRFAHSRAFPEISAVAQADQGHCDMHVGATSITSQSITGVDKFVAAADDFTLFHWIGQPVLHYVATPLVSTTTATLPSI